MTELQDFLAREVDAGSFPGAVALVGTADSVVEIAAAGQAVVEPERVPATPDTLYDLASLTKPLVSGALVAAALPRLDLSSPPGRYLTEWKATRFDGVTIETLLAHTSGLPAWRPLYAWGEGPAAYRRTLAAIEPETAPGERVTYSDLNFLVLGDLLEAHFSAPLDVAFADLVRERAGGSAAFLPRRTGTAATERDDATERGMAAVTGISYPRFRTGVVWGEVHDGNAFRRGGVAGNAGLFGTARDVWALSRPWLDPSRRQFVADRTPSLAQARGLAWQGSRGAGSAVPKMPESAFGHTGFTGTSVWIDPEGGRIFVLLTNRIHPGVRGSDFNAVRRRFHEAVWS
ncbi:MAG: beta-lactamase family protein [Acidobacteriota bacterium]|nr:beta-lactamase family protein [Acidobacteriota bacterium]MDQ5872170.1 beta-lactamase family protein [Acidobacteriota bacterium]